MSSTEDLLKKIAELEKENKQLKSNNEVTYRIEKDSMGELKVPNSSNWGAQTQRSKENFKIAKDMKMPYEVIKAFAILKQSCAKVSIANGDIPEKTGKVIIKVCEEIINSKKGDKVSEDFPLLVFQTGSGTQTNMNMNEVIANKTCLALGAKRGDKKVCHPNDHVNRGQSSNDTFPTAMHIACGIKIKEILLPALNKIHNILREKQKKFMNIVKCGRTHCQDATPLRLGDEFSAWAEQMKFSIERVEDVLKRVHLLAIGGTAVGTGLNTREDFGEDVSKVVAKKTGIPFKSSENKFEGLSSNDTMAELSGVLNTIACSLFKIANDIRLLSCGPRCGFAELKIPANEPGSSIMPGKVNPTQCEAVTMACAQIMGNHTAVTFSCAHGHFQLNVFKPVIIFNVLQSIEIISDCCHNFTDKCLVGIEPNEDRIKFHTERTLMSVTILNGHIGYDKASIIVKKALKDSLSLKEAAVKLGYLTPEEFDEKVQFTKLVNRLPKNPEKKEIL